MQELCKNILHNKGIKLSLIIISLFILAAIMVSSDLDYNDPLSRSIADSLYCMVDSYCVLDSLTVGNLSIMGDVLNISVINYNVTGMADFENITAEYVVVNEINTTNGYINNIYSDIVAIGKDSADYTFDVQGDSDSTGAFRLKEHETRSSTRLFLEKPNDTDRMNLQLSQTGNFYVRYVHSGTDFNPWYIANLDGTPYLAYFDDSGAYFKAHSNGDSYLTGGGFVIGATSTDSSDVKLQIDDNSTTENSEFKIWGYDSGASVPSWGKNYINNYGNYFLESDQNLYLRANSGSGTIISDGNTRVNDNDNAQIGSGGDYWFTYSSANNQLQLWTTDGDGAGTNSQVFNVDDGTIDTNFVGDVNLEESKKLYLNKNNTATTVKSSILVLENIIDADGSNRYHFPSIEFKGEGWSGGAPQNVSLFIGGQPNVNGNPSLKVRIVEDGGVDDTILKIDSNGQFESPLRFAKYGQGEAYNDGVRLGNDANADGAEDEYAPRILWRSKGYNTGDTTSDYTSWSLVSQPEGGSPVKGVLAIRGGHDTSIPDTELMRYTYNGTDFLVGISTDSPTYPLEINSQVSGISLHIQANISATGYIKRSSVYDKSRGKALNFIKDSDYYKDLKGEIDHSKFYGYAGTFEVADYTRPENKTVCYNKTIYVNGSVTEPLYLCEDVEVCRDAFVMSENKTKTKCFIEKQCHKAEERVCEDRITYPHKKTEKGVSLNMELDVLRQAVYELKTELCNHNDKYNWC